MSDTNAHADAFQFIETGAYPAEGSNCALPCKFPRIERRAPYPYRFDLWLLDRVIAEVRLCAGLNQISSALAHSLDRLWITCDPDNRASRTTCERLGAVLVEVVTVP